MMMTMFTYPSFASAPPQKQKFYDFGEQLINGEIRKPTAIYMDVRRRAKFNRLLKLKKSFLPRLFDTAKNKIFK
tara:strand:+ start:1767 stop:1988 length:222 start_codon:yes stop_codon:yes gene_type:complete